MTDDKEEKAPRLPTARTITKALNGITVLALAEIGTDDLLKLRDEVIPAALGQVNMECAVRAKRLTGVAR